MALSLLASAMLGLGALASKRLTLMMPARQLVGPLLLLNAALLAPAAPFITWSASREIITLHLVEASLLALGSLAVWDLLDHGEASATVTAQSLSPLPAAVAVGLFIPGTLRSTQAVSAAVVVGAVLYGLAGSFPGMPRPRTWATISLAAITGGLLTVTSRLLADANAGVVQTYLVRTTLAALVVLVVFRPTDVPMRQLPRLAVRASIITAHFILVLMAVRRGSPAVVQTVIATSPLLVLAYESSRKRRLPSPRVIGAAVGAACGVAIVFLPGVAWS